MLSVLFDIIQNIIGYADDWMIDSTTPISDLTAHGVYDLIVTMTACILVILTVTFVFKFILKLVER